MKKDICLKNVTDLQKQIIQGERYKTQHRIKKHSSLRYKIFENYPEEINTLLN